MWSMEGMSLPMDLLKTEKTPISELKHAKELREEWFTNDD